MENENINTINESTVPSFLINHGSNFSNGFVGLLLASLFGPWGWTSTAFPTLPKASAENWKAYEEESKNVSDEERRALFIKYIDPGNIAGRYMEKLSIPEEVAKLNKKLAKADERIAHWTKKKQDIIDKWVRS